MLVGFRKQMVFFVLALALIGVGCSSEPINKHGTSDLEGENEKSVQAPDGSLTTPDGEQKEDEVKIDPYRFLIRLIAFSADSDFDSVGGRGEFNIFFKRGAMVKSMSFLNSEKDQIENVRRNGLKKSIEKRNGGLDFFKRDSVTVWTGMSKKAQAKLKWKYTERDFNSPYILVPREWVINGKLSLKIETYEYNRESVEQAVKSTGVIFKLANASLTEDEVSYRVIKTIRMNTLKSYYASYEFEILKVLYEEIENFRFKDPTEFIPNIGIPTGTGDDGTTGTVGRWAPDTGFVNPIMRDSNTGIFPDIF